MSKIEIVLCVAVLILFVLSLVRIYRRDKAERQAAQDAERNRQADLARDREQMTEMLARKRRLATLSQEPLSPDSDFIPK